METATIAPPSVQYLEAAQDIARRLCRDAIWDGNRCNWIGANVLPVNGRYQVARSSCPGNVYSGLAGIALFLAQVSTRFPDPILEDTLEGCVRTLLWDQATETSSNYAYYSGKLGIADSLIRIGIWKNRDEWIKKGEKMLARLCKEPIQETELDIIGGVAGAIPVLLLHYKRSSKDYLLEAALRCGQFLLDKAEKSADSWTWISMPGSPGLTGYSHGNAGIALGLLELWKETGEEHWKNAGMMGFAYERKHFDPRHQNWPDLRKMPGSPERGHVCAEAWCHGAPGIALSRLRAWQLTGDATLLAEAQTALQTTRRNILKAHANFSLCHGTAGNADVLLVGGYLLNDQGLTQAAHEAGQMGIERYQKLNFDWPAGVSDPAGGSAVYQNPSLLLGLAGTGYFYLRLAFPRQVPSVLLLSGGN